MRLCMRGRRSGRDNPWVPLIRKGRDLFRPYEVVVLDALSEALSPTARRLLSEQIACLRKVQRLYDQREVNLYAGRRGAPPWPDECSFPNQTTELRLATVRLASMTTAGHADVFTVRGHTFQIPFRPSPKQMGDLDSIHATGVNLHADPLEDKAGTDAELVERLPDRLRTELERLWSSEASSPLLGRNDIYEVDLDDGTYMMLAQLPDTTFAAVRLDPTEDVVHRFDTTGSVVGTYDAVQSALQADS